MTKQIGTDEFCTQVIADAYGPGTDQPHGILSVEEPLTICGYPVVFTEEPVGSDEPIIFGDPPAFTIDDTANDGDWSVRDPTYEEDYCSWETWFKITIKYDEHPTLLDADVRATDSVRARDPG